MILLDGGTGRELARLGAPFRVPEWSALALIEAPEFVTRVHESYVAAGAQVITCNSYAIVPFHLGQERFDADGERLAELAGRLARRVADAAPHPVRVAGSLPPVCGSYRPDLFNAAQARPVLQTLVRGLSPSVDMWLAETLGSAKEAELVRTVLAKDARPLWLSFTLRDTALGPGQLPVLRSGEPVAVAVMAAVRLKAEAILFNCSQPEVMEAAVEVARRVRDAMHVQLQLGAYANAFPPQPADADASGALDPIREDLTPEGYCEFARLWQAKGATIVGGCCGIGPEHIARLRSLMV